jgi:hypothetical protein
MVERRDLEMHQQPPWFWACGIHNRRFDDHSLLPGINLGDIGGKFGSNAYNSMDDGVPCFDHVCIPREQMLMRFVH